MKSIKYIHEPTDLQCGQTVLAMLLSKTVDEIIEFLGNERETTLKEMKKVLDKAGVYMMLTGRKHSSGKIYLKSAS